MSGDALSTSRFPDPEVPTRLVLTLAQLLAGLDVIGVERDDALNLVRSVPTVQPSERRLVLPLPSIYGASSR
jgi:hypothetical protein